MIPIPLIAAAAGAGIGALSNKEDRLGGALKGALMGGTMGVSPAIGGQMLFSRLLGMGQGLEGGEQMPGQTVTIYGAPQTGVPTNSAEDPYTRLNTSKGRV